MATATQLMPSPTGGLKSAFSPYTDSPSSPATFAQVFSNRSSGNDHLLPPNSPYPSTVDPSPVDSNGTSATEIEDDAQVNQVSEDDTGEARSTEIQVMSPELVVKSPDDDEEVASPGLSQRAQTMPARLGLNTTLQNRTRADSDVEPQSVIHAPPNFKTFDRVTVSAASSNVESTASDQTAVVSPQTPEANMLPDEKHSSGYTHPIDTQLPSSGPPDRTTPRAQTRQDFDEENKRRSRASVSLADIAETEDVTASESTSTSSFIDQDESIATQSQRSESVSMGTQTMGEVLHGIIETEREVAALRNALDECWILCNSLSKLSQHHRHRMFHFSGRRGDVQEHAWRTCWRLCQTLYDSRNEDPRTQIMPTLELCRDFCQALFDVRQRGDETTDSVLRVSFELNNHLYNAHDRALPEAFRERTLDFYLTLCHRLMKQRTSLPEETDALLHACWSLAEMLFSIRQSSRDGKPWDEEILGSAIQACWELCDLFREGWSQVRPDRGTPRPSQYSFAVASSSRSHSQDSQALHSEKSGHSSSLNQSSYHSAISSRRTTPHPETPTTIFDEREEASPAEDANVPNILVLGPEAGQTRTHDYWSSSASNLSTYSENTTSVHSSSTATLGREDPNLIRLKGLIIKAAINAGYTRQIPLADFVRTLPSNSFGTIPWQITLFDNYKKLVVNDPTLRTVHTNPLRRLTAIEIGRAVQWMARSEQFAWMRDLYRYVFGNFPEDNSQRNMIINA